MAAGGGIDASPSADGASLLRGGGAAPQGAHDGSEMGPAGTPAPQPRLQRPVSPRALAAEEWSGRGGEQHAALDSPTARSRQGSRAASLARTGASVRTLPSPWHGGMPRPGAEGKMGTAVLAVIAANTMNGPGLLAIPTAFRHAGWFVSMFGLTAAALLTGDTAALLSDAIGTALHLRADPARRRQRQQEEMLRREAAGGGAAEDEEEEEEDAEFGSLAREFLGSSAEFVTQVLLVVSLTMLTCAQVVVTAQAIDAAIVAVVGYTSALQFYPTPEILMTSDKSLQPFGTGKYAVSVGFIVDMAMCTSLSFFDLSDNMIPQYLSYGATVFAMIVFGWQLLLQPPLSDESPPALPAVGDDASMIVGVAVFNFAYIIAIPSLYAEMSPTAKFTPSMWSAVLYMLVLYCYVGLAGGAVTPEGDTSGNILNLFIVPGSPGITRLAVFTYAFALVLPIPVYVILLRRNLELGGIVPAGGPAVFTSNAIPWGLALVCYLQPWFGALINWSSLLCLGFINYSIPLAIVIAVRREALRVRLRTPLPTLIDTLRGDVKARRAAAYFAVLTTVAIPAAILLTAVSGG